MKFKYLILSVLFVLSGTRSLSANIISGRVTDLNNEPVAGVNIFIKNSYEGSTSGVDGKFIIKTKKTGTLEVVAKYMGYEDCISVVSLQDSVFVPIQIKEKQFRTNVVTVTAGAFEAGDEKKAVILSSLDIVTTAGSNADIVRAFETLPGVSKVGEGEGLYVRGGDGREAAVYIDGAEVKHPYYSKTPDVASRGRFSPYLFKGSYFSTGGFSAEYGKALSSAMILNTIDFPEETYYQANINLIGAGAGFNKKWKNNSLGFNYDGYNLGAYNILNESRLKWSECPAGSDVLLTYRQKTSENGMLKFTNTLGTEKAVLKIKDLSAQGTVHSYSMRNLNLFSCLNYKEILSDKWILNASGSFSRNYDFNKYDLIPLETSDNIWQVKTKLTYLLGEISTLNFGGDFASYQYYYKRSIYSNRPLNRTSAGFVEAQLPVNLDLLFCAGLRIEHSSIFDKTTISPRFSVSCKIGENETMSFATGRFFQLPADTLLSYIKPGCYESADHYILNFQSMTKGQTFRAELYYKNYAKLLSTLNEVSFSGHGYAAGMDIYWRDKETFRAFDYRISYSFLNTKRKYMDFPAEAVPSFASTHTLSLVMKKYFTSISSNVSLTYQYSSGRTYLNPNNTNFLSDKTKDYHNLSVCYVYLNKLWGANAVWVLSAENVLGLDNIFSYKYSDDGQNREAIKAASKRTVYLGLYISFGRDNSDDF